jgi:hypothetical protein
MNIESPLITPASDQVFAVKKFQNVTGAFIADSMG